MIFLHVWNVHLDFGFKLFKVMFISVHKFVGMVFYLYMNVMMEILYQVMVVLINVILKQGGLA
jgi:hypothetical protein